MTEILRKEILKVFRSYYSKFLSDKKENSDYDALEQALIDGTVTYSDGAFRGKFNSKLTKLLLKIGARFLGNTWRISDPPSNYLNAAAMGKIRDQQKIQGIIDNLSQKISIDKTRLNITIGKMIDKIDDSITVKAQFTDDQKRVIAENYTENMELTIKGWHNDQISKLRKEVGEYVRSGKRYDQVKKLLIQKYDLLPKRAQFIARQEVNLLTAQMHEQKCRRAGLNRYVWRTREDSKVRKDHAHLDGEIFDWDHPPVVDLKTGRRGHPGQDYNCRCYALSIIE